MTRVLTGVIVLLAVLVSACGSNAIYDEHKEINKEGWSYTDTMWFDVDMSDVTTPVDVIAKVRITSDYPKENIYLKIFAVNPQGKMQVKIANINLADPFGKWTGEGVGDYYAYESTFISNTKLDNGKYRFGVMQFMRYDVLPQVHDVGIKVNPRAN